MTTVQSFTFNPFQENTYIVYDDTKQCVIIDPGCSMGGERRQLTDFIEKNQLLPVRLLNTHCHIDHVMGNAFVAEKYGLGLEIHERDLPMLQSLQTVSKMYGIPVEDSPMPSRYMQDDEVIEFGTTKLQVIYTPGHSPGSVSFFCEAAQFVISGDVLFHRGVGRTDLPGGDTKILFKTIREKLFPLGDAVKVYSGHGVVTTIGAEKGYLA
jgi:hydroxyacylglutathione hydrolase